MTYYGAHELVYNFRTVRNNTIKIANEIPEDKYSFSPAAGCRTVAQTLTHIAVITRVPTQIQFTLRVSNLATVDFMSIYGPLMAEEQATRTKDQILQLLREEGDKFATLLSGVTEDFLAEKVSMPPGLEPAEKSRFEMLLSAKEHEMHHRGQLMVVERMLGVTPHLTRQMQERIAAMQAQAQAAGR
ncbi:MAG TPA: DinB family protein [Verrucomicrobiae bacterium]|nr:DinB family protein [Verrucomicrobiae bacterium]